MQTAVQVVEMLLIRELGLRSICFKVDDLEAVVDGPAANGYGLVGGIGQHGNTWRMAHARRPEGIVVSLPERIGSRRVVPATSAL